MAKEVKVGEVVHYYGKIHVVILELDQPLYVGQTVRIKGTHYDFIEPVERMEWEHLPIAIAEAGQQVGIQVHHKAHEHDKVYLV